MRDESVGATSAQVRARQLVARVTHARSVSIRKSERAYKPVAFGGAEAVRATVLGEAFAPTLRAPWHLERRGRGVIRRRTVDALATIEDPAERVKALYKTLELQPENASKGHLFTEYRRDLMIRTTHEGEPLYDVDGRQPKPFEEPDLARQRKPDDVVRIRAQVEGKLPPGRYAIEDKAGDTAFRLNQAEAYARRSVNAGEKSGGFKLAPERMTSEYDGIVYVFSRRTEAKVALERMSDSKVIRPVLGKHPGGIHVMYLDMDGLLKGLKEL